MSVIFDAELKKLKSRFMEMGIDTGEQLYQATKAFLDHDVELAKKVLNRDHTLNDEEISLEKRALKLMALQQPLANDFREIISILKASNDLERIGDYTTHIARATVSLNEDHHVVATENEIAKLATIVRQMLEKVMDAYANISEKAAYEVANMDLQIDVIYVSQQKAVLKAMQETPSRIPVFESYLGIIRTLERTGDHIVNLAEWIIYIASGKLVELNLGKADPKLVQKKLKEM